MVLLSLLSFIMFFFFFLLNLYSKQNFQIYIKTHLNIWNLFVTW